MDELSWKIVGHCLFQQPLHVEYPCDEDACKQCIHIMRMYESYTQTWQGCNKAVFITTKVFAWTFVE